MTTIGDRYFPQAAPVAVAGGIWFTRLLLAPVGARRLRTGSRFRVLVNPTAGIDLPVTHRMRTSASEP